MTSTRLAPPSAESRSHWTETPAGPILDPYYWLRNRDDPSVLAYLTAENAYADTVLAPVASLREQLYGEMLGRIKQTDLSVPARESDFWYYSRTVEGKQYPIYCRKYRSLDAPEEILLDLNELARGHSFMALGAYSVSPDGTRLAYSTDPTGFREYTLYLKDLETGGLLAHPVERVDSVAWAADSATVFYTEEDDAKRSYRLYRFDVGQEPVLITEEQDERFRLWVAASRSRKFLFLTSASHTTSEVSVLEADQPLGTWRVIAPRIQDREYDVDHAGDHFLIRVNDTGRNFRVVRAPEATPEPAHWVEVLPHRADVMVEGIDCFASFWVTWERSGGLPAIRVTDVASGQARYIAFPETAYEARPGINWEWTADALRYEYESLTTPTSVYDYEVESGVSRLLKRREVLGGYDASRYVVERLHAVAADGTRIPISLVRRAGTAAEPAPLLLTGYGAYGIPYPLTFSSNRISLLDRGVTVAIAHVRGGGEFGRPWHDGGRMAHKMNTFTDFIAVADHLIAAGYTASDRLVIEGGSAGGLLIGAVVNLRPDLVAGAILQVPFVDVITTMLDPSLPLTVAEYEEWGNPAIPEEFEVMRRYCPYTNLGPRDYPALLVRTGLNDSQVMYWEPAKYVARLRTLKTDDRPLLLTTNLGAGHGGSSGRYDRLREIALDYSFILWVVGRTQQP